MEDLIDQFNNPYNGEVASLKGRCYRAGYKATFTVGTHYFFHSPTNGKKLSFISFSGSVVGKLGVSLLFANSSSITVGATQQTINGYNLDNTLGLISSNPIKKVASITGAVNEIPLAHVETPNSGGQSLSNTLSSFSRSIYNADRPAIIKIVVETAGIVNLVWIWEEV
jgi:hypothetical protein